MKSSECLSQGLGPCYYFPVAAVSIGDIKSNCFKRLVLTPPTPDSLALSWEFWGWSSFNFILSFLSVHTIYWLEMTFLLEASQQTTVTSKSQFYLNCIFLLFFTTMIEADGNILHKYKAVWLHNEESKIFRSKHS